MIFDTAVRITATKAAQLKANGVTAVIRYLTTAQGSSKLVTAPERDALFNNGIALGLVFENWGGSDNFAHNDINANNGAVHGRWCNDYVPRVLKAPVGTAVYFAIDTDC